MTTDATVRRRRRTRTLRLAAAFLLAALPATARPIPDRVAGTLVQFNDNGAWCWFQDERALVDRAAATLLIGSVAAPQGAGGPQRGGNVELTAYDLTTRQPRVAVLHAQLEADDHNAPALLIRPDGRYLAMYTTHKRDTLSRWRISTEPHDAREWHGERIFDWRSLGSRRVTYSNLHLLSAGPRLFNFARAINDDPAILRSTDQGDSWSYGGKLLTIEKLGYVNGYVRYASNGVDRIDLITTEHHPRNFDTSIYHGYLRDDALHDSTGTVVDATVLDGDGRPQTELTRVFAAGSAVGGEPMSRCWTTDLRLDPSGRPVALFTCRANDVPADSNVDDHRFLYARFDGTRWQVHQMARAGAPLWPEEEDYTGLGALRPGDPRVVYVSTPIDPRQGAALAHHEIFAGVTDDGGATWRWTPITEHSSVDNLRPIVPPWDAAHTAVLWLRGRMRRSQDYDTAVVGIFAHEHIGPVRFVAADSAAIETRVGGLAAGTYDVFAFLRPGPDGDAVLRAGLSADRLRAFRRPAWQAAEAGQFDPAAAPATIAGLARTYLGRVSIRDTEPLRVTVDPISRAAFAGVGYAPVLDAPVSRLTPRRSPDG